MKTKINPLLLSILVCCGLSAGLLFTPISAHATDAEETAVTNVIEQLKTAIQQEVDAYHTANPGTELQVAETETETYYGPFYKPDTLNAFLRLNKAHSVYVEYVQDCVASGCIRDMNYDVITELLETLGFEEYGTYYYPAYSQYINDESGVICAVLINGFDIGCGHINWQNSLKEEWKDYINGIGKAYYKKENAYPILPDTFSDNLSPKIVNSDYEPYQYTEIDIENYVGIFYRPSPTSEWVYFDGVQAVLDCDEFTGDAQKGFAGYACVDSDGKSSKVKVTQEDADSKEILTPDTGAYTKDARVGIATLSVLAISLFGFVAYVLHYIRERQKAKVSFSNKK
ncbi:hypothetical protein IJJ36_02385 [Candidatus Saccharibacteria bacterium]|nr:hypothetical protein [Candidatus Saccharibacteria bacterium]